MRRLIDTDTLKLLRIPFSYFLLPVFFFALSQATQINWLSAVICFVVLHLLIYPASNGYNSFMDKDETSIGGLERPPEPTRRLYYVTLILDLLGLVFSLVVGIQFFVCVLAYILVSKAYSYRGIRLKKYPVAGFLVVIFFQGAFTFWMVYNGVSKVPFVFDNSGVSVIVACLFLIGGVYPLTQIYQHAADAAAGDHTISYRLGIRGTFVFCSLMFAISGIALYHYFSSRQEAAQFRLFMVFLIPVLIYFIGWFLKVLRDEREASFKNTMRMNMVASTCMSLFFITILIINNSCLK